jgi:threonine aldolase
VNAVDLRSDTVTTPTAEMRRAMADAEVGDDVYGEDPTVNRLQSLAASLLGKEAALYVPSGTMANQLAIRVLAASGTEVLCPDRAHVYRYEAAAAPVNSGVQMHPLWDLPDGVRVAIEGVAHHLPQPALVVIENTYMALSGAPIDAAEMTTLCDIARAGDLPVHVDGARIWNAAIALGTSPRDLVAPADTVMFCLSKGLGAPVGSLLCGPAAVIAEARAYRARWGGAMRQAGVIAAAGIVALETMVERLAVDHVRARALADALADRWPGSVDPRTVRTNIVCADLRRLPADFVARLERLGVRTGTLDPRTFRLVTHKDVDDDAIARAVDAFDDLVRVPLEADAAGPGRP